MDDVIVTEQHGAVGVIRFNRAKQLNALNSHVAKATVAAAKAFDADPEIGCIVLTGSEKAFAAGADISEMSNSSGEEMKASGHFTQWEEFANVATPKIAAVNGFALGGGCEVMMMCDFAIAGEGARFGQPEVKLGVIAGMGGTQRMTRLIGRAKSMDMHLTGRMMEAAEALQTGLVARVVPDADVFSEAMAAAEVIAGYSRPAIRAARKAVMQAEELPMTEGLAYEQEAFYALFGGADQIEGMAAFVEKRPAKFTET